MKFLLSLMLAASASSQDNPKTFLVSVVGFPLKSGESIPGGWRIKAGNSATPDGVLEGEGSQGATWFNRSSPRELRSLALVILYAPVQRSDVRNGPDATFKGAATISTDKGERKVRLTYRNVHLTPARHCP